MGGKQATCCVKVVRSGWLWRALCVFVCSDQKASPEEGLKKLDSVKEAGMRSSVESCPVCLANVQGRSKQY